MNRLLKVSLWVLAPIAVAAAVTLSIVMLLRDRDGEARVKRTVTSRIEELSVVAAAAAATDSIASGDDASASSPSPRKAEKPKISITSSVDESDGDEDEPELPPDERRLAERIEKALDEENLAEALACAGAAYASKNVEIRSAMVETLGWFGHKAIAELTPFMADSDEDVAESARDEWTDALSDIDDETERISVAELAMKTMIDEEALEIIADEYIGVDEKLAVESLVRIIEGGEATEKSVEKAKETYEFVTGDEYENQAAAEKWIAEEYEPDDASDAVVEAETPVAAGESGK